MFDFFHIFHYNDTPSLRCKTEASFIETTMKASYCKKNSIFLSKVSLLSANRAVVSPIFYELQSIQIAN